jgi:hypothetical protein
MMSVPSEDNVFWRRLKGVPNKIEAVGAKALCETDAEPYSQMQCLCGFLRAHFQRDFCMAPTTTD